ncbi:acyltransferase [Vibrio natriegens]|uniref:Acetyltransferase n=1 Tax=Vibrio natriegens NBRC 15636 = ATCC 14048 = DSM 759 TaxID=1219067 RepID=A0AAN1CW38_VIBNA|nr:acyltransferase [Vibrio natriegens]ALR15295.1 acetyltransferase [Vibrio natriegens NBRC 15636 = ATCC 14048 = DSM 759]ANQ12846.1 acetyltransferase [Vibrio natriegens NBRC 15636 = ATCC 14048 = DSM 759]EPM40464.1 acetyltransferase [Vibrio natriegens NBRC 15636 = ATCC 14048 = DSM 759]MDX6027250.1 acyltransferase [Vibrio natriegens NBRC 15636 = ATCC 14048 = DSM 759]UUI10574.1 acyltransferase [Vibrio natriegens]
MLAQQLNDFKVWLQHHENPSYRKLFLILKSIRACDLPTPMWMNKTVRTVYSASTSIWNNLVRVFIHTPAFKGRLSQYGRGLYLFGGVPFVSGPLSITLGDDCRISGQTTFSARPQSSDPQLIVGSNVDIGWQSTFAIGSRIEIGDNVRIAGRAFLFGYSGHSLDADLRAKGFGDLDCDVGDIVLAKDVWLGTNVTVCPNVTIGEGTIVGAGSVVTKDLPAFVVAAGNPARVIRSLNH